MVTKDVPDFALVYGNPARVHGWVCVCGVKLPEGTDGVVTCADCGAAYERLQEGLVEMKEDEACRQS